MDSIWVVLIPSPFANMAPLYEIDPDADVLVIVPPKKTPLFAPLSAADTPKLTTSGSDNLTTSVPLTTAVSSLRIKASSKHLALASRIFRNKLAHFHRRTAVQPDGRVHLTLAEGFDPSVVVAVLNAIHSGRGSARTPRRVDGIETLAQIALFVNRFELYDAVEVYAERWVNGLLAGWDMGEVAERELVLWLYVGFVFRRHDVFGEMSKVLIERAGGLVRGLGLPVKERIIRDIETQRRELLDRTIVALNSVLDELADSSCESHCGTFLLGELVKTLHKARVLSWPSALGTQASLDRVSYADVVKAINNSLSRFQSVRGTVVNPDLKANPLGFHKNVNGKAAPYTNGTTEQLPTPNSSPVLQNLDVNGQGPHQCDARRAIERLGKIRRLASGIDGLKLETELGYQIYR